MPHSFDDFPPKTLHCGKLCPRYCHRPMCTLNMTFSSPCLSMRKRFDPVLRYFYLKKKVSNKDLEAECKIYASVFKDRKRPKISTRNLI